MRTSGTDVLKSGAFWRVEANIHTAEGDMMQTHTHTSSQLA